MQEQRARKILQALVQGVDPATGAELEAGTVLQRAEVLRALLAGVTALEQVSARAQRRAQLPDNVGRPWSPDEERALVTAFQAGDSAEDIAAKHGRTLRAIEARLERLGLLSADQRTTNNSFTGSPTSRATDPQPP
jgi:DNA-binding NarL/FixJ family response regulator